MRRLIAALCLLWCSGCGYTFQGGGSILPPDIKRIYIPLAENDSTESGLSQLFTEALRDRFEGYGQFTVVDRAADADATLKARILKVSRGSHSVTAKTESALQLDTILSVSGELRRRNGAVLWRDPLVRVSTAFSTSQETVVTSSPEFASGSLGAADVAQLSSRELSRGQEAEALATLSERAAELIYDEAVTPDF